MLWLDDDGRQTKDICFAFVECRANFVTGNDQAESKDLILPIVWRI